MILSSILAESPWYAAAIKRLDTLTPRQQGFILVERKHQVPLTNNFAQTVSPHCVDDGVQAAPEPRNAQTDTTMDQCAPVPVPRGDSAQTDYRARADASSQAEPRLVDDGTQAGSNLDRANDGVQAVPVSRNHYAQTDTTSIEQRAAPPIPVSCSDSAQTDSTALADASSQAEPKLVDDGTQAGPNLDDSAIQAAPSLADDGVQAVPRVSDAQCSADDLLETEAAQHRVAIQQAIEAQIQHARDDMLRALNATALELRTRQVDDTPKNLTSSLEAPRLSEQSDAKPGPAVTSSLEATRLSNDEADAPTRGGIVSRMVSSLELRASSQFSEDDEQPLRESSSIVTPPATGNATKSSVSEFVASLPTTATDPSEATQDTSVAAMTTRSRLSEFIASHDAAKEASGMAHTSRLNTATEETTSRLGAFLRGETS